MPRYYLNIKVSDGYAPDLDGSTFSTLSEAMRTAKKLALEAVRRTPDYSPETDEREIEITDEDDTVLATVPFKGADETSH
jgi:hypothetical protein